MPNFINIFVENTHSAKQLLTSPTFILMIIVNVCAVYLIMTLFVNMPRYFEIHFRQPAAIANVTVGEFIHYVKRQ